MASLKTFYRDKKQNRPVAQFFDRMPWYFSVGFRWSVGRLKGWSDERRSVALPPMTLILILSGATYNFEIHFIVMIHY